MKNSSLSIEVVATKILLVRGKKVILNRDLARLYGVKVKRLNEQVKRNIRRFPGDFMFQLTLNEAEASRSQIATLNEPIENDGDTPSKRGENIKYLPYAFTEQGVAMLSSVLNSERAIRVNIAIMRAFVKLREILLTHKDLAAKLEALERKYADHDEKIQAIFNAIKQLLAPPEPPKAKLGF